MTSPIEILDTQETTFFSHDDSVLRQWLHVTVYHPGEAPMPVRASVRAGSDEAHTDLELLPGARQYRVFAPLRWPKYSPIANASLKLAAENQTVFATVPIGHYRPWVIYLLSDCCTDYLWAYHEETALRQDDAALLLKEIELAEATAHLQDFNRNRYNLVHARQVEFFLEHYPDQSERLMEAMQHGMVNFNPFYNMIASGACHLEELIRHFYPARGLGLENGLDMSCANHQETPTITWILATILAGMGIHYLVKSILPFECPWVSRLEEPPLFQWQGPDGSKVLVRRRNQDYFEGNFVLKDLREINHNLHDRILPYYENLAKTYPFDAIAMIGCYGDLSPKSTDLPAKKTENIIAYNNQGWEYPRLVNAVQRQYWDDIQAQINQRKIDLPTFSGDYGTAWDAWPSSLANLAAEWRYNQEGALSAEKIAAVLTRLAPTWYSQYLPTLRRGWTNLTYLSDHAWNGAYEENRQANLQLRRAWNQTARHSFDSLIASGLETLAGEVKTGEEPRYLVFNLLGWERTSLACLDGLPEGLILVDAVTRQPLRIQRDDLDNQRVYFTSTQIPALGYRVASTRPVRKSPASPAWNWHLDGNILDGPFYTLRIDPHTGGIANLIDKQRDQELVDPASSYHLNQAVYLSEGSETRSRAISIRPGMAGPVFGELVVKTIIKNHTITSTIRLYYELDRVDILNRVEKIPSSEKQELDFAFPFWVPGRQYRYEAPGVILNPEVDLRPGSGQAVTALRHFIDVFNEQYGITLSMADSYLVKFGHNTTLEDPRQPDPNNSTIFCIALQNILDWNESIHDQGGDSRFIYRYSLRGHAGGFNPTEAIHFAWQDHNELRVHPLARNQAGHLPEISHSFVEVEPHSLILSTLKPAEDGGLIVRLWNPTSDNAAASLRILGLGRIIEAFQTDLLERSEALLEIKDDSIELPVPAAGLATARILFEHLF